MMIITDVVRYDHRTSHIPYLFVHPITIIIIVPRRMNVPEIFEHQSGVAIGIESGTTSGSGTIDTSNLTPTGMETGTGTVGVPIGVPTGMGMEIGTVGDHIDHDSHPPAEVSDGDGHEVLRLTGGGGDESSEEEEEEGSASDGARAAASARISSEDVDDEPDEDTGRITGVPLDMGVYCKFDKGGFRRR